MHLAKKISITAALASCLLAGQARADWRSILNDLTGSDKSVVSEKTVTSSLDVDTVISGLKEALQIGSQRAIEQISQQNGFLNNPEIHIPPPPQVTKVSNLMRQFGMTSLAEQFETSLNHAAEQAAPAATQIVVDSIRSMTIDDAKQILNGPDDAATQYFKNHTQDKLTGLFRPTIENSLNQVGSTRYYNQLSDQIAAIPVVGQELNVNLPDYVTQQALDGLFTMLAQEEKKIRDNPTARTTELLQKVFQ